MVGLGVPPSAQFVRSLESTTRIEQCPGWEIEIMHARTMAGAIALAAVALPASASTFGGPPLAQSYPLPNPGQPNYVIACHKALETALANQDKTSAANMAAVQELISHARDSQAKGRTFACVNEANHAADLER
jgi:hypothetical protein